MLYLPHKLSKTFGDFRNTWANNIYFTKNFSDVKRLLIMRLEKYNLTSYIETIRG